MVNILKEKKAVLLSLILALLVGVATTFYYKYVCSTGVCSYQKIAGFIIPTELGAYIMASFFAIFLFLPSHYFNKWFKYIFVWAFPLSVYLVYITTGSSSIPAYGKEDIVKFWGMFYAIVTVLFIIYTYIKTRKKI